VFEILPSQTLEVNDKQVVDYHIKHIQIQEYHYESIILAFQKYSKYIQAVIASGQTIASIKTQLNVLVDCGNYLDWDIIVLRAIITDNANFDLASNYIHPP